MKKTSKWNVALLGLDHMHAGDNIRDIFACDRAELVGLWDSDDARLNNVGKDTGVSSDRRFNSADELFEKARPDVAVVCSTTQDHTHFVEMAMAAGAHVILEKPFAVDLAAADEMIAASERFGKRLAINWPAVWQPAHQTAYRLITEGQIGEVREIHSYGGNRGPLWHSHDKKETNGAVSPEEKRATWWYRADMGGGSLLDYLGYGATLGTWFRGGGLPSTVTACVHVAPGDEVDEQSVVIAAFPGGLSTYQTRWGTFTDPWTHQPQPQCGYVIVGDEGTISSFDYADHVTVQTRSEPAAHPVVADPLATHNQTFVNNVLDALDRDVDIVGPLSPWTSRSGQRIIDSARQSAQLGQTVPLIGPDDSAVLSASKKESES